MRKQAFLVFSATILSLLLGLYTNCSPPSQFSKESGGSGTVVGNPMTSKLLASICGTITRCHADLAESDCSSGVSQVAGLGLRFGLPASFSGPFTSVMESENTGEVKANTAAVDSCVAEIQSLDCSNPVVRDAYDASAPSPFGSVANMIPATVNSCASSLYADRILWTWMAGRDQANQVGVYGTKGASNAANLPGARTDSATTRAPSGEVYLFGGIGYDSVGDTNRGYYLNDLWKWNGSSWTWLSGSDLTSISGVYGTKGAGTATTHPGSRQLSALTAASNGDLWLFGGYGHSTNLALVLLNDLWKRDAGSGEWIWVTGANSGNSNGVYGQKGVASPTNHPGAREGHSSWRDSSGFIWIFGGYGYGSVAGQRGVLNDLWRFNPQTSEWTWISGSDVVSSVGSYGTRGATVSSNLPRSRSQHSALRDSAGNVWVFGGYTQESGSDVAMNDLWKWDGTNWTWISGSSSPADAGVYGTLRTPSNSNRPGARTSASIWGAQDGSIWIFGGTGLDGASTSGELNDIWKFDGANWAWMAGSNTVGQISTYGMLSVPSAVNTPGGRHRPAAWTDAQGDFWLFGGASAGAGAQTYFSDLWRFQP